LYEAEKLVEKQQFCSETAVSVLKQQAVLKEQFLFCNGITDWDLARAAGTGDSSGSGSRLA